MLRNSLLLLILLMLSARSHAQGQFHPVGNDTIRLGGIIVGKDTLPMVYLDEVEKHAMMPRYLAKRKEQLTRLRYNIYKVYPYAVTAADVLQNVDGELARIGDDRSARKAYLKQIEKELNRRWKGELEDLTITQGQILVKLIDRETGKNCYSIIREMKGGFTATVWQGVALLFSNNLKREYDPWGADRDIEAIVQEIETSAYYHYQAQMQRRN
jgi:hypothetical protein